MPRQLPRACLEIIDQQNGVISRAQALASGIDPDMIGRLVRGGRWQRLQRGVYSAFTGPPNRDALLWSAVQRAGPGAVLSHQTAAELFRLTDTRSSLIHVTIPVTRRSGPVSGVVIHRSRRVADARHPALQPPRTRIEDTVIDLVDQSASLDMVLALACAACQRRLTRADLLLRAMSARKKLRWRAELSDALADIGTGVHSPLEFRYVRGVERPHGLPAAKRQVRVGSDGRPGYLDNLYDDFDVIVELDGRVAHPDDQRWRDARRDNAALVHDRLTLRYGWADVTVRRCATAIQVGSVLKRRGWQGQLRPCGPQCPACVRRTA
jgi:hypothetical protein